MKSANLDGDCDSFYSSSDEETHIPEKNHFSNQSKFLGTDQSKFLGTDQNMKFSAKTSAIPIQLFNPEIQIRSTGHTASIVIEKKPLKRTTLVKSIAISMFKRKIINECVVFSSLEDETHAYSSLTDKVYTQYDDAMMTEIIAKNTIAQKNLLVIIDDCIQDQYFKAPSNKIKEVIANGDTCKISLIFATQCALKIQPEVRCNFDYCFLGSDNDSSKRIYTDYCQIFQNYNMFNNVFGELTKANDFMVVINTGFGKTIGQKIFYFSPNIENVNITIQSFKFIEKNCKIVKIHVGKNQPAQSLFFNKFDVNEMVDNSAIVMVAKRGSGKSFAVVDIINQLRNAGRIDDYIIISPTERMNKFYGNKGFNNVYYEYTNELLENVLAVQSQRIEQSKLTGEQCKRVIVVMDDCLGQKGSWAKDKAIQEMLFNGRHYKISYILTMQFPLGISPELRCNFDYIFLFAEDFLSNQKRIYDHYAGMFPTFDSYQQVFKSLTEDFNTMIIINRGTRSSLFDKVKFYKANAVDFCDIPEMKLFEDDDVNIASCTNNNDHDDVDVEDFFKSKREPKSIVPLKIPQKLPDVKLPKIDIIKDKAYDFLNEIAKCNNRIVDLVKNDENSKKKEEIISTILKCNNEIVNLMTLSGEINKSDESDEQTTIDDCFDEVDFDFDEVDFDFDEADFDEVEGSDCFSNSNYSSESSESSDDEDCEDKNKEN